MYPPDVANLISMVTSELSALKLAVPALLVPSVATNPEILAAFKVAEALTIKLSPVVRSVTASVPEII